MVNEFQILLDFLKGLRRVVDVLPLDLTCTPVKDGCSMRSSISINYAYSCHGGCFDVLRLLMGCVNVP